MSPREQFERWHKDTFGFVGRTISYGGVDYYVTATVQTRWEAWKACSDLRDYLEQAAA